MGPVAPTFVFERLLGLAACACLFKTRASSPPRGARSCATEGMIVTSALFFERGSEFKEVLSLFRHFRLSKVLKHLP